MFGKLNPSEMCDLLENGLIGHLACVDNDRPYLIPISYGFAGSSLYFYSKNGKKLDILRRNPSACFQVDNTRDLSGWKSVVCYGKFEELTSTEDKKAAFRVLTARRIPYISSETMHLTSEWPYSDDQLAQLTGVFFRIVIEDMTGRFEKADESPNFAS